MLIEVNVMKYNPMDYDQDVFAYYVGNEKNIQETEPMTQSIEADSTNVKNPYGSLLVQTFMARETYPVIGATVSIRNQFGTNNVLYTLTTDGNGQTGYVELLGVPEDATQHPSDDLAHIFERFSYQIDITHPEYIPVICKDVPIFAGISSIQTMEMIPLSLSKEKQGPIIVEEKELEI